MKFLILLSVLFSLNTWASDEVIDITTSASTCGEAGVKSYSLCHEKAGEDGYRYLDLEVTYQSEKVGENGNCQVKSTCSFYQIID